MARWAQKTLCCVYSVCQWIQNMNMESCRRCRCCWMIWCYLIPTTSISTHKRWKCRFLLLFFLLSNECECMRPKSSQNERLVRCWCIMCPYIRCWSLFQAEWIDSQPKTYIRSCLTQWNLCWLKWIAKLFCFDEKGAHGNGYSTEILPLNNEKESRASCNKERRADNILLAPRAIFNANQNWYSLKSCILTAWFIVLYCMYCEYTCNSAAIEHTPHIVATMYTMFNLLLEFAITTKTTTMSYRARSFSTNTCKCAST